MDNFDVLHKIAELQSAVLSRPLEVASPSAMPPWMLPLFQKMQQIEVKLDEMGGRYMRKEELCEHLGASRKTLAARLKQPRSPKPVLGKYLLSEVLAFLKQ